MAWRWEGKLMRETWRWFGEFDPIALSEVAQTGAAGIVSALHAIPYGEVWPRETIAARKAEMADAEEAPKEDKGARALECQQENPKRDQSKSWKRYEAYKAATCGADVLAWGGYKSDVLHDYRKGFLRVTRCPVMVAYDLDRDADVGLS